jgi:hypothetical protein
VARVLERRLGVRHVDPDGLVARLLARGARPDPVDGWLEPVREALGRVLREHGAASVEATGAWESDWRLGDGLEAAGVAVVRAWVIAPFEVSLRRLRKRPAGRVAVGEDEAAAIWTAAVAAAEGRRFDVRVDTAAPLDEDAVAAAFGAALRARRTPA